jgi:signal transduction histidine kinase
MTLAFSNRRMFAAMLLWASGLLPAPGQAAPFEPYAVDAHTLHLWHLDEAGPPFADQVADGTPLAGLLNGAKAGQKSLPGFGSGISFNANAGGTAGTSSLRGAVLAASPILATGPADNLPPGFRYFGPDGAFTYEMVVKLDTLPKDAASVAVDLLTMEGDDADRIFSFRIEREGFLAFFPLPHGAATGGGVATIPTTGPHAVDTSSWFHVAVTYDGNSGATNNLKLYWTRLDAGASAANCIGSGSLSSDFNGNTGDLAIGNEARSFPGNAEAEPFPGLIDEVRISGVARHPGDFFFVPPGQRVTPERVAETASAGGRRPGFNLALLGVFVDSEKIPPTRRLNDFLELTSGLHRLDFDFGFDPEQASGDVKLRCLLEGVDERWRDTELGMTLVFQALDADGRVVSQSRFHAMGRSTGWETNLEESPMSRRAEPVFIPPGSRQLRISLASGPPDTTGFFAIDDIALHAPGARDEPLWRSGGYAYDSITTSPAGFLPGWKRNGADPAIARLVIRIGHPALGLVDGDQSRDGEWFTVQDLPPGAVKGGTFVLSWDEVFNVIDGDARRATYVNVPPGRYVFRAMGVAGTGEAVGDSLAMTVLIHPPVWQRAWFWPAVAAGIVAMIATVALTFIRQGTKRSMERLRFQNALEQDRTRIARDMHDDLGTRVTFINLCAALARREIETSPENARRHLAKMTESARDLVVAMDDLVWAVDPSNDTLDDLASHLTRLADEMFRDSPVRCRLDIPSLLPPLPLGSEFRHHVALAVKESLHNVLRHAGPCEVFLALAFDGDTLRITIRDTGTGFDPSSSKGHGLDNLSSRFKEIGGSCVIESSPGRGTRIVLSCPVSKAPQ